MGSLILILVGAWVIHAFVYPSEALNEGHIRAKRVMLGLFIMVGLVAFGIQSVFAHCATGQLNGFYVGTAKSYCPDRNFNKYAQVRQHIEKPVTIGTTKKKPKVTIKLKSGQNPDTTKRPTKKMPAYKPQINTPQSTHQKPPAPVVQDEPTRASKETWHSHPLLLVGAVIALYEIFRALAKFWYRVIRNSRIDSSVTQGLDDAKKGKVKYRGKFSQYLDKDDTS